MGKPVILIVEDERITSIYITKLLKLNGYDVMGFASSGEESIKMILQKKPDLVLMDVTLDGDMDGIDTAMRIRAEAEMPIIFLTAYNNVEIKRRAEQVSCSGFLTKPILKNKLLELIKKLIKNDE